MRALLHMCAGVLHASHAGPGWATGRCPTEIPIRITPPRPTCGAPTRALCAACDLGAGLSTLNVCRPGQEQSSRKVQACSLKSHLTQPSASPMGSRKGQRSSYPPRGHMGSGQLHSIRDASANSPPPGPSPESLLASRRIRRISPYRRGPHTSQVRSRGS